MGGRAASGWRAGGRVEKQKTENRGGPGPPLRLDTRTWLLGQGENWSVPMFPETKKETRGSPALFVSGNFQGNQRVFGAPFWQLSSFPESESWSGAKSEAKPRKPAKYAGYTRYILPIWPNLGPNQPQTTRVRRLFGIDSIAKNLSDSQTRLRARKNGWVSRGN